MADDPKVNDPLIPGITPGQSVEGPLVGGTTPGKTVAGKPAPFPPLGPGDTAGGGQPLGAITDPRALFATLDITDPRPASGGLTITDPRGA